jgi:hypothetical protein
MLRNNQVGSLVAFKFILTILGLRIFWALRHLVCVEYTLRAFLAIFSALMVHWLDCLRHAI